MIVSNLHANLHALVRTVRRKTRRRGLQDVPELESSSGEDAWQECIDKNLYGANTPDYSLQAEPPKSQRH